MCFYSNDLTDIAIITTGKLSLYTNEFIKIDCILFTEVEV